MRFVKPLGKAAKFTAVTMPLSIFGWQLNKRLFFAKSRRRLERNWEPPLENLYVICELERFIR